MLDILKEVAKLIRKLWEWLFQYPVIIDPMGQFETEKGYVFVVNIYTKKNKVITVPKSNFNIKIVVDKSLARKIRKKQVYGEYVEVFESETVLKAHVDGRSYGNVLSYVRCHKRPQLLFLLTRVAGPGSQNPCSRFQLGNVYKAVKVKLRKRLLSLLYIEIPIGKPPIISGNDKTRIVDS